MSKKERKAKRLAQARWRARHPVLAAWHVHKWNAKKRGIAVHWTLEEFAMFCTTSGYHLLRADGYEIDRKNHHEAYSLDNCQLLTKLANGAKGGREGWKDRHTNPAVSGRRFQPD